MATAPAPRSPYPGRAHLWAAVWLVVPPVPPVGWAWLRAGPEPPGTSCQSLVCNPRDEVALLAAFVAFLVALALVSTEAVAVPLLALVPPLRRRPAVLGLTAAAAVAATMVSALAAVTLG